MVSDTSAAPDDLLMAEVAAKVTLPCCVLLPDVVVLISTLVPAFSAALMVATLTVAVSLLVAYVVVPATGVLADIVVFAVVAAVICRSFGSISHRPAAPCAAVASGVRVTSRYFRPDVSTNPPLPPFCPPRALMSPLTRVASSEKTMTRPPSPLAPASARSEASDPMNTASLFGNGPRPWRLPPTWMSPPPDWPDASTPPSTPTFLPSRVMSPPLPMLPVAAIEPPDSRVPPAASMRTLPPDAPLAAILEPASSVMSLPTRKMRPLPSTCARAASMVPELRMVVPKMPTCPASATICPTLRTALSGALSSTRTSGDAAVTSSILRPAARMIWPPGLVMSPEFSILGATR